MGKPETGQVRVAVEIAAITFIDTMIRRGSPIAPPATFPIVLGNGVGGTVDRLGPGVAPRWLGARVVTTTGGRSGYASLAVAAVEDLHHVPESLSLPHATALLADGRTAVGLHRAAEPKPAEAVVVTAAAGGVGSLLVQLAKNSGARVIAVAGSPAKLEHAIALGADATVNYRDDDWPAKVHALATDGTPWSSTGSEATPRVPCSRWCNEAGDTWHMAQPAGVGAPSTSPTRLSVR